MVFGVRLGSGVRRVALSKRLSKFVKTVLTGFDSAVKRLSNVVKAYQKLSKPVLTGGVLTAGRAPTLSSARCQKSVKSFEKVLTKV